MILIPSFRGSNSETKTNLPVPGGMGRFVRFIGEDNEAGFYYKIRRQTTRKRAWETCFHSPVLYSRACCAYDIFFKVFYCFIGSGILSYSSTKEYIFETFEVVSIKSVSTHDSGVILSVKSTQQKLCETHNVRYSNTKSFTVNGRKVTIDYIDNTKRHSYERLVEFYILPDDATYWAKLSSKFNK